LNLIGRVRRVEYHLGQVSRGRKRRYRAQGTTLSKPVRPNDLWCADYKGEFMLADRRYCYPLTISDFASPYLLACEALGSTKETYASTVFERVFKEFGLPKAIRTDNGVPFARARPLGLSKLSVWWLLLGIHLERIQPGRPQQNGRRERMHLIDERADQALDMKYPAELYQRAPRPYHGLDALHYPLHDPPSPTVAASASAAARSI